MNAVYTVLKKIRHLKIHPLSVSQGRLFQRTVCGSFLVESATYNRMHFLFTGRWVYNWGPYKWRGLTIYWLRYVSFFTQAP